MTFLNDLSVSVLPIQEGLDLALAVALHPYVNEEEDEKGGNGSPSEASEAPTRPSRRKGYDRSVWTDAECVCELLLCYTETYVDRGVHASGG